MIGMISVLAAGSIDIDITIAFQMVIFGAVYFVIRLYSKDYLRARDARAEGVVGSREEADELQARTEQLGEEYEERMITARRDAHGIREALRNEGQVKQDDEVDSVRAELDAKLAAERAKIADSVDTALDSIDAQKVGLAELIYKQVVPSKPAGTPGA